ncbi:MAG: helix-turn-helix transcriptional regulator [Peptostreptococcaceae bacterium]|nr:helix-turn-helix transcriptional regulator [Peptostreptococcaceae bacterium]
MEIKPVKLGDLLSGFADYLTISDVMAANALAKISGTIVKKRLDMNMNQKEFAVYMEVSQSMVSKWESENYNYSIESLAGICEKLNLKLEVEMKSTLSKYEALLPTNNSCGATHKDWNTNMSSKLLAMDEAV